MRRPASNFRAMAMVAGMAAPLLIGDAANAYVLTGISWPGSYPRVPYYVSTNLEGNVPYDGSATFEEVVNHIGFAAETWNTQAGANFEFVFLGTTSVDEVADDGINAVIYNDGECPVLSPDQSGCSAKAYYHQTNGVFRGFDIVIYQYRGGAGYRAYWKTQLTHPTQMDLWSQMLHEFGHAVGLAHSNYGSVVMGCNCGPGCVRRNLTSDDIAGVQALYGEFSGDPPDGPQVAVLGVRPPGDLVGGVGPRAWAVDVFNNGTVDSQVPVTITIGGLTFGNGLVEVPPMTLVHETINVITPQISGGCGQVNNYAVTACAYFGDGDIEDNCTSNVAKIAVPYWDLDFDIVSAPSSARRCTSTNWSVRVTNRGNVPSMNVCAITGIGAYSGAGRWNANLGLFNFTTPNIQPGQSWTYRVNNYFIGCAAFLQTQYIKTEVHYSAGCFDNCAGGNYDQQSILIKP